LNHTMSDNSGTVEERILELQVGTREWERIDECNELRVVFTLNTCMRWKGFVRTCAPPHLLLWFQQCC
jgi:hypothetical protein